MPTLKAHSPKRFEVNFLPTDIGYNHLDAKNFETFIREALASRGWKDTDFILSVIDSKESEAVKALKEVEIYIDYNRAPIGTKSGISAILRSHR